MGVAFSPGFLGPFPAFFASPFFPFPSSLSTQSLSITSISRAAAISSLHLSLHLPAATSTVVPTSKNAFRSCNLACNISDSGLTLSAIWSTAIDPLAHFCSDFTGTTFTSLLWGAFRTKSFFSVRCLSFSSASPILRQRSCSSRYRASPSVITTAASGGRFLQRACRQPTACQVALSVYFLYSARISRWRRYQDAIRYLL
ncbi:hypothetical protein P167DRAFT_335169 [Morchella conica CCBAS932]|uniref:Uncharacterized protein n=1 Tax=Morchella conica CCBAS932 TaxID=1392247 RepID=A0A3N4KSP3_9PEZI|nr:hypothetical protein P167DRAFT_335169 [Morchella conica CCBAS932]